MPYIPSGVGWVQSIEIDNRIDLIATSAQLNPRRGGLTMIDVSQ